MAAMILIEFLGTFFLVLCTRLASGPLAGVGVAATLTALIYAGGPVSGAHYNPCVTFANWLRGACGAGRAAMYVVAQFAAAASAVAISRLLVADRSVALVAFEAERSMLAEFLFTFAMIVVILHAAAGRRQRGNQYFGLAIGAVVLGAAVVAGPVSGAMLNPAVVLGSVLSGAMAFSKVWWWLLPQFAAAVASVYVFRATDAADAPQSVD